MMGLFALRLRYKPTGKVGSTDSVGRFQEHTMTLWNSCVSKKGTELVSPDRGGKPEATKGQTDACKG